MKYSLSGTIAAMLVVAQASLGAQTESGFKSLFNGNDLSGWDGNSKLWSVKEGAITGRTSPDDPLKFNTFLVWTNGTVGDFELRCAFKIVPNNDQGFANSGIQYRSKVIDPKNWVVGGYQADLEAGQTYTGILYEEKMTRAIMAARGEKVVWDKDCKKQVTGSTGKSDEIQAAIKKNDWNDYVVIAKGPHLQHFVNGRQTVDVQDDCESKRVMNGVLALQLHAGAPMTVQFRDLRLKQLSGSADSAPGDLKSLQGVWQATAVEANGDQLSPDEVKAIVVTIKGNSYTAELPDRTDQGTFKIDSEHNPKQMDVYPGGSQNSDGMMPAIYELASDSLKVCYAQPGGKRPASFSSSGEYGLVSITYKRKAE